MRLRYRKAITLTEVLVSISILAIIAAIIYPIVGKARVEGLKTACVERQRQLYQAFVLYGTDNPGYEMVHANVDLPAVALRLPHETILPYIKTSAMLHCPAAPECAKAKLMSTYTFAAPPAPGAPYYTTRMAQFNLKFDVAGATTYPIIYTLVFDELYYQPSERHLSNIVNPPFITYVRSDGSGKRGRFYVPRDRRLAYACGGQ